LIFARQHLTKVKTRSSHVSYWNNFVGT
jgi:hypothetical protein